MSDPTATLVRHELMLALAGRIDDDLLAWARELIAVGEDDQALELVVGTLLAERVVLPPSLRERVNVLAEGMSVGPDPTSPLELPVNGAVAAHRFGPTPDADPGFDVALAEVADRMLTGCRVWRAWRLTPSGGCPGPVPHPVVLVEFGTSAESAPEVLAYQVADALKRAGYVASVEVFTASMEVPEYHQAAMVDAEAVTAMAAQAVADEFPVDDGGEPMDGPAERLDELAERLPHELVEPDIRSAPPLARPDMAYPAGPDGEQGAEYEPPYQPPPAVPPLSDLAQPGSAVAAIGRSPSLLPSTRPAAGAMAAAFRGDAPADEPGGPPAVEPIAVLGTGPAWEPPHASELEATAPWTPDGLSGPDAQLPRFADQAPSGVAEPMTSPVPVVAAEPDTQAVLGLYGELLSRSVSDLQPVGNAFGDPVDDLLAKHLGDPAADPLADLLAKHLGDAAADPLADLLDDHQRTPLLYPMPDPGPSTSPESFLPADFGRPDQGRPQFDRPEFDRPESDRPESDNRGLGGDDVGTPVHGMPEVSLSDLRRFGLDLPDRELPSLGPADHRLADNGSADHRLADNGSADNGSADNGSVDNGSADRGSADYRLADYRGSADNGSADNGSADYRLADYGSADSGPADFGLPDLGAGYERPDLGTNDPRRPDFGAADFGAAERHMLDGPPGLRSEGYPNGGWPQPREPREADPVEPTPAYEQQIEALSGLTDTERALLRELHQELASRESRPRADRPPGMAKLFNGGTRPRQPRRPEPPDLAG